MTHVPKRGDAVWINFNPQSGHEQAGRRPAIDLGLLINFNVQLIKEGIRRVVNQL